MSTDGQTVYVAYGPAVLAYDPVNQKEIWTFRPENRALLLESAPSVQDGRVIFGDYGAAGGMFSPTIIVSIYGLEENETATPTTLWLNNTASTDKIVGEPLQVGDVVFVGSSDFNMLALDANTGAEIWRFKTNGAVWSQAGFHDGTLYVTSMDKHIYALDAETGTELWSTELAGAISATPIVNPESDLVYVGAYDNALHALDLQTGTEQWQVETANWIWSAPALDKNTLYFADSNANVYAADATNGDVKWTVAVDQMQEVSGVRQQLPERIDGTIQASPVVANGKVYIASEGNANSEEGLLVALDTEDGSEVWQRTTRAALFTTPVIVDDMIIVAMRHELVLLSAFDLESGEPLWSYLPVSE